MTNCPNCGAPITAEKCAYCGTVILDFAAIQVGAPSYVKFKLGDTYICTRLVVTALEVEPQSETVTYTDALGATIGRVNTGFSCGFHMDAHAVCTPDDHTLVTIIQKE